MDKLLYPNARNYLASQLWAIRPETLDIIGDVLRMRANGVEFSQEEIQARIGSARSAPASSVSVCVIPLYGVIDQKIGSMSLISGGTAVNAFMDNFRAALNDSSVTAIVLDVDSPGGSVSGIPEAANEIYNARGKKPILAVADPMIASAAYWLSCAADEIVCMPSGQVGSIGVVCVHDDFSEANKMAGYKPTYITYGQYKAETNSDAPLTPDAQEYLQGQVNQIGDMFTRFVAKARGVSIENVRAGFGQGRMLTAKDALAARMIDTIGTLDQTIARMTKAKPSSQSAQSIALEETVSPLQAEECSGEALSDAAQDVSTMTEREASKAVLVGLQSTITRWGGLVDRTLASGKKPGAAISKTNTEQILELREGVMSALEEVDTIMLRAGIEPVKIESVAEVEETSNDTAAESALAEFELIRARSFVH